MRVDPKRLYDPSVDLTVYDDVPLDPQGGPCLLFPGTFEAVVCFGQEKDDDSEDAPAGFKFWLLKLGIKIPGAEGRPPIYGHWWIRIYQKHSARLTNFLNVMPIDRDGPEREMQPDDFRGQRFLVEVDYGKAGDRLWPQKFKPHPEAQSKQRPQQPRRDAAGGAQTYGARTPQRAQGNGQQQQRQPAYGRPQQATAPVARGYGQQRQPTRQPEPEPEQSAMDSMGYDETELPF